MGLIAGFVLSIAFFSCSTQVAPVEQPQQVQTPGRDLVVDADPAVLQQSFRDVAAAALPSVVRIDVEQVRHQTAPEGSDVPWFDFFFGQPDGQEQDQDREFRTQGLGSGIIVRRVENAYYILTNVHVIGEAETITVTLDDGSNYPATIVGKDERKDLALILVETDDELIPAVLGDSDTLAVGDWVLAIGSPYGFQSTVTAGIVSALGRRGGPDGNISDFIQTDASINRGNSGGALVNLNGEVVGINTWITSQTGGSVGLGFSIPINNAIKAIDDFVATGTVKYGWLGVSIRTATPEMAQSLDLPNRKGALIHHVFRNSPADLGGLLPGDFIRSINGVRVEDSDSLVLEVSDLPVGKTASFVVIRYGQEINVDVAIAERQSERVISEQNTGLWPGFSVFPVTDAMREELDLDRRTNGVFVTGVESRTPASTADIRVGDIITGINGTAVTSMLEFFRELNSSRTDLTFSIMRDGESISARMEG